MTQNKTKARVTKMAAVQKIGIFNILQKTGMYCSIATKTKTKTTPTQGHNHKSKNQTKELKNGRQNKQQTTTPPPTKQNKPQGPLLWDCVREKKSSCSVCESEICSVDEGCKSGLQVRHISQDLGLNEAKQPTSLFNNNRGCCNWS